MTRTLRIDWAGAALACLALPLLAACTPDTPDKDAPPEPQAEPRHTELRDAIQQPIDRAKAVDAQVQDGADAQRKAVEDAGG